jgi:hypothetical protein
LTGKAPGRVCAKGTNKWQSFSPETMFWEKILCAERTPQDIAHGMVQGNRKVEHAKLRKRQSRFLNFE